jgi:hypothetical protein
LRFKSTKKAGASELTSFAPSPVVLNKMLLKVIRGTASGRYALVPDKKAPTRDTGKGCCTSDVVHRILVSTEPAESVPIIIPETRIFIK